VRSVITQIHLAYIHSRDDVTTFIYGRMITAHAHEVTTYNTYSNIQVSVSLLQMLGTARTPNVQNMLTIYLHLEKELDQLNFILEFLSVA
jgi:hypothetical protein